ncbi:hypothetical protein AS144_00750 [Francisella endosymbiont of Amblyomma maculatum]|nr:hypothetical protein AS144_00750 [Francisella endosymbiont of Amblyomma maculatum]
MPEVVNSDVNITQAQSQNAKPLNDVESEDGKANIEKSDKAAKTDQEIIDISKAAHSIVN